jgi:predicted metal-dependent hydrolase
MNRIKSILPTVELSGRSVPYTVTISRTAKRCRVRVGPAGIEVVLPRNAKADRAEAFLRENAEWVLEQVQRVERLGNIRTAAAVLPDTILLRGEPIRVNIVAEDTRRRYGLAAREGDALRVRLPKGNEVDAEQTLLAWMRRQARADIEARLAVRTREMRCRPNRVYIMSQRTKWGNCSRLRNLSFNWRLVMAPPNVLDYIVVHELAHLREPYHSAKFWLIVRSHCPEYEAHRTWLSDHESQLYAFGENPR